MSVPLDEMAARFVAGEFAVPTKEIGTPSKEIGTPSKFLFSPPVKFSFQL